MGFVGEREDLQAVALRLREACRRREPLDLRDQPGGSDPAQGASWPTRRHIEAATISEILAPGGNSPSVEGAPVHIVGARILGSLDLRFADIKHHLTLEGCYFDEQADLSCAKARSISLRGSRIVSVKLYGLRLEGDLDLSELTGGGIDLFGARVGGMVWLSSAVLEGFEDEYALSAPDVVIDGGMYCRGLRARGGVNLYGARIGSTLELDGATLTRPRGSSLAAAGLAVGLDLSCLGGFISNGTIDLFGAHVGGQLWLNGARIEKGEGRYAMSAPLMRVAGGMYCLHGFRAVGGLNLFGVTVGATLEIGDATLDSPGDVAFRAPGLIVNTDLSIDKESTIKGKVDLSGAQIGGLLLLGEVRLDEAVLDLRRARLQTLLGSEVVWGTQCRLSGLTYEALQPYAPAAERVRWIALDPDGYHPQTYEDLGAHYRRLGDDEQSRTVLLANQRARRDKLGALGKLWGYVQDIAVGYGYRPGRALIWLLLITGFTAIYFTLEPPTAVQGASGRDFQAIPYAIATIVPFLDLGQSKSYVATGVDQYVRLAALSLGWVLVTTVVAAITRAVSRN